MGGGSAALRAALPSSPRSRRCASASVRTSSSRPTSAAATSTRLSPPLQGDARSRRRRHPGFDVDFFAATGPGRRAGRPVAASPTAGCCSSTARTRRCPTGVYSWRATARFTPTRSGVHTFTLGQSGQARLFVDGEVVLDGVTDTPPRATGTSAWSAATSRRRRARGRAAGRRRDRVLERRRPRSCAACWSGAGRRAGDLLERAVAAAAARRRGHRGGRHQRRLGDRGRGPHHVALPGDQDELVRAGARGQPEHGRGAQHRFAGDHAVGRRRPLPSCRCGSAARRWPARWPTCSPVRPIRVAGCR